MTATTESRIPPSEDGAIAPPAVLLVDDRPENLLAMEAALEPLALELVRAGSARDALRLVGERRFAVIVLDVQMPEMDGYEVARRIEAMERPHVTPIVFVTALDRDRRHAHAGFESGAIDYLFKPLDPDELRAKVRALASLHVRAETALRESEARYRALFESIDEGFAVVEVLFDAAGRAVDYRFVDANAAFLLHAGLAPATRLVGRTMREVLPGIEAHFIERYGVVARTGAPTRFTGPSEAMGRWLDAYAFRTGEPDEHRVALLLRDVTAAKTAERERERLLAVVEVERSRLAAVFAQAPSVLAIVRGPDHVLEMANDAYLAVNGHRDVIGKPLLEAVPELRDQGFDRLLDAVIATGEPYVGREVPIWLSTSPGAAPEERFFDFVYLPLVEPDADGAPRRVGVIAHGNDITEQVRARRDVERARAEAERAEDEAEAARAQAEEASQAKSAFLATMSHELRTPINAIVGYTQLMEIGLAGPLTEQQREYLGRLTRSGEHLLSLVNDVLDLSKIEAGELSARRDDAWTGPSVDAALDLTRPLADARGVALVDERPAPQGVPFVGDEQRVRQIVVNLLSNAVKFTEAGGRIVISSGTAPEAAQAARVHGSGPWAWVRVSDTGIGIAPEQLARIFEPFHQVEGGHTRKAGGTGLGLAISRRLARLMGGDLAADSAVGRGSTFTLWLPAADAMGARSRMDARPPAETAAARRARAAPGGAGAGIGRLPGLDQVGEALRASLEAVIESYVERLRADPELPEARGMSGPELEDHHVTLLSDLAQSLVIIGGAGADAPALLRDGSAIQRTIAEHHGVRRRNQGWSEAAVRRGYDLLRAEVEHSVRRQLKAVGAADGPGAAGDEALRVVLGLLDKAEGESVRAWRRSEDGSGE